MKGTTSTERLCDACGAPAVYTESTGSEDLCEECAKWRGATRHGEACIALEAIGFGIAVARLKGLSDDQIGQAVESILIDPVSSGNYPTGGDDVLGRDFKEDRPWMRTFRPLAEAGSA